MRIYYNLESVVDEIKLELYFVIFIVIDLSVARKMNSAPAKRPPLAQQGRQRAKAWPRTVLGNRLASVPGKLDSQRTLRTDAGICSLVMMGLETRAENGIRQTCDLCKPTLRNLVRPRTAVAENDSDKK